MSGTTPTSTPTTTTSSTTSAADKNRVSLVVGGKVFLGWQSVRITAGLETFPRSFQLEASEDQNNRHDLADIEGKTCVVKIGSDDVVTGFVERVDVVISANRHAVQLSGRGRGCDLIDCSASLETAQITNATIKTLADTYCKPYGIEVVDVAKEAKVIPTFAVSIGMTPYDILELAARHLKLAIYEDGRGRLVLARGVSTGQGPKMASGFKLGVNVEQARASRDSSIRY